MNIAFIPARGGSKSIPLKNIKLINGKPLIYWGLKAANDSIYVDKVILATDSEEIKKIALSFGLKKVEVYDRKKENALDNSSTESVMLEYIEFAKLDKADKVVLIQATSPLIKTKYIDEMFEKLEKTDADSIFSVVREKQFHWIETKEGVKPINYNPVSRPRRQDFQGILAENGACYINFVGNIVSDKCRLSGKIEIYEMPEETKYEIDEEKDWIILENLMKQL